MHTSLTPEIPREENAVAVLKFMLLQLKPVLAHHITPKRNKICYSGSFYCRIPKYNCPNGSFITHEVSIRKNDAVIFLPAVQRHLFHVTVPQCRPSGYRWVSHLL